MRKETKELRQATYAWGYREGSQVLKKTSGKQTGFLLMFGLQNPLSPISLYLLFTFLKLKI